MNQSFCPFQKSKGHHCKNTSKPFYVVVQFGMYLFGWKRTINKHDFSQWIIISPFSLKQLFVLVEVIDLSSKISSQNVITLQSGELLQNSLSDIDQKYRLDIELVTLIGPKKGFISLPYYIICKIYHLLEYPVYVIILPQVLYLLRIWYKISLVIENRPPFSIHFFHVLFTIYEFMEA